MTTGLADFVTSPFCGFLLGRGKLKPTIWVQTLGMSIIGLGYIFLGPIPPLRHFGNIGMTVGALFCHGIGLALSYIGNIMVVK